MRVERDGVELEVDVEGPEDGPPVVFLHGVSGSGLTYGFLPPQITTGRRIIRVDLRGHGGSDQATGTYDIDTYGEDVAEVLRRVAGRPAVVVGHSLGGVTAWWLGQRVPELVAGVFMEDPPIYMGEPAEHEANQAVPIFVMLRDQAIAWQEEGVDAATAAARMAGAPGGPDPSITNADVMHADAILARAEAHLRMDPAVLTGALDRSTLGPTDTDAPVEVPAFLLAADDAKAAFPIRHEQRMAASHPDVEVVRLEGASHGIHDELAHRDAYLEHLARFLDAHAPVG
jgi:pimeloyl-ACP methyl ester carboxylesterase